MKLTPIQKRAERKSRNDHGLDMNLVALIDIFTILIFFLMSSTGIEVLSSARAVKLPESTAEKTPRETVVITVSATDIVVDGRKVAVGQRGARRRRRPDRAAEGRARPAGEPPDDPQGERGAGQGRHHHGRQGASRTACCAR